MRRKLFNMSIAFAIGIGLCFILDIQINKEISTIIGILMSLSGIFIGLKYTSVHTMKMIAALLLVALSGFSMMAGEIYYYNSLSLQNQNSQYSYFQEKNIQSSNSKITLKVLQVEQNDKEKFYLIGKIIEDGQLFKSTFSKKKIDDIKVKLTYYGIIDQPWKLVRQRVACVLKPIEDKTLKLHYGLELPKVRSNPRCFDYNLFLRTKGIAAVGTISAYEIIDNGNKSLADKINQGIMKTRALFSEALNNGEESQEAGLIVAILFGDTGSIEEETYKEFKENGTAHVLAVSGLHIGIIFSFFKKLFGRKRSLWVEIIFLLMLLCYGTLTLWSVSATRAIGIIVLSVVGDRINCRFDLTTALGLVAFIILFRNPYQLLGAAFQMSFIAVASIVFIAPKLEKWLNPSIAFVLAVQLGMLPYIAYTFNYISIISLICNIPIVYLVSLFVPMGMGVFMAFIIFGNQVMAIAPLLKSLASLVIQANHTMSLGGLFCADIVSPPLWFVVVLYAMTFFFFSESFAILRKAGACRKLWQTIGAILLAGVLLLPISSCPLDRASMIFLDVGQGDGVHLRVNGQNVLIDGGGTLNYNVGEKILKPYFLKNGVNTIDFAIVTHLHTDHFLGVQQLSKEMKIEKFVGKGRKGQIYKLGKNSSIEILWPLEYNVNSDDENRNSMVMKVNVDNISCLITGDIGWECEEMLLRQYRGTDKLKCDILKVAHHGSKYSSSDEFIDAVDPRVAIIQVGKNNYGHPNKGVIEKFNKKGIIVYRTDYCGAVGIKQERGKIRIWQTIEANIASKSLQTI